jgi:hypothetical protein
MSTETATNNAVYATSSTSGSLPGVTEADPSDRPTGGGPSDRDVGPRPPDDEAAGAAHRALRRVEPRKAERLTGAVYGTIVAAAVVAAASGPKSTDTHILVAMLTTAVVFWLAHVFSRVLAESMEQGSRIANDERLRIAREEWPMLTSCLPLAVPLLLGAYGVISSDISSWVAITVAVVMLGTWGYRIGQLEGRGRWRSFRLSLSTAAFGLVIVVLKVGVSH